jgi:hypothetical protein
MDHDQRFKAMIREFFADFLRLFFPEWAECFDLTHPEWLDKELLANPPDGDRHLLDLVARLKTTKPLAEGDEWLALVHIEVESADRSARLKPRLPRYYVHLRESQELPVLPIVLYLRVGMDGIGIDTVEERIGSLNVLTFRYLYVGLPSLDAVQYASGENWLGVAFSSLMNAPRESWPTIGTNAVRRLVGATLTEFQRFLLYDCFQAYLPLDEEGRQEFERFIMAEPSGKIVARNKTHYDLGLEVGLEKGLEKGLEEGLEKGIEKGIERGLRSAVTALLESRFQSLAKPIHDRLETLNAAELQGMIVKIPQSNSIAELFPPS